MRYAPNYWRIAKESLNTCMGWIIIKNLEYGGQCCIASTLDLMMLVLVLTYATVEQENLPSMSGVGTEVLENNVAHLVTLIIGNASGFHFYSVWCWQMGSFVHLGNASRNNAKSMSCKLMVVQVTFLFSRQCKYPLVLQNRSMSA